MSTISSSESLWSKKNPSQEAERTIGKIISKIQPTAESEEFRRAIVTFLKNLIRTNLGVQVFPFGSVPLKTYLKDGDIDLTILSSQSVEENLMDDVYILLKREEHNVHSRFHVRDLQQIKAEVKLVKCSVDGIVVDISFNQLRGLSSLCFLHKVDSIIGKDHLFKKSILLVKAWCYYESRVLGGQYALISTYALEIMLLYIFQLFHASLDAPLAVLYKFLDYFTNFDYEKNYINLYDPILESMLGAQKPNKIDERELLFSKEFLKNCAETLSVQHKKSVCLPFVPMHLNIVDPLSENNNLGRSISIGNFYRIRSVFAYAANKLGKILLEHDDNVEHELYKFFSNTSNQCHGPRNHKASESLYDLGGDSYHDLLCLDYVKCYVIASQSGNKNTLEIIDRMVEMQREMGRNGDPSGLLLPSPNSVPSSLHSQHQVETDFRSKEGRKGKAKVIEEGTESKTPAVLNVPFRADQKDERAFPPLKQVQSATSKLPSRNNSFDAKVTETS